MRQNEECLTFLLDICTDCVVVEIGLCVRIRLFVEFFPLLVDVCCFGGLFSELCFDISRRILENGSLESFVQSMRGFLYNSLLLGLRKFCGDISVRMFGESLLLRLTHYIFSKTN